MKRYVKFIDSIAKNKKPLVQALGKMLYNDVRTTTGTNLRHILLENDTLIIPGITKHYHFKDSNTYEIPAGKEWKIGLLSSLLKIQDCKWMISFDEEGEGVTEDEV